MPYQKVSADILKRLRQAKEERRQELAVLPIEEKVKIVIELQKIHNEILRSQGKPELYVWEV